MRTFTWPAKTSPTAMSEPFLLFEDLRASCRNLKPDSIEPCFVLGLHEDGTQAGNQFGIGIRFPDVQECKPRLGQLYKRQVEIAPCASMKNGLRACGG